MNKFFSIFNLFAISLSLVLFFLTSCSEQNNQAIASSTHRRLIEKIGKPQFDLLQQANSITLIHLKHKEAAKLTPQQVGQIKKLLLADSAYLFDRQKRCPFFADYTLLFNGDSQPETALRLSISSAKIQFSDQQLLDCDPALTELENILNIYNR